MKNSVFKAVLALLLACIALLPTACEAVDPLTTKESAWNKTTAAPVEKETESAAASATEEPEEQKTFYRPANADWSEFESGEENDLDSFFGAASAVLNGNWFYPSEIFAEYSYPDIKKYCGKYVQTAFKYDLATREYMPFCMDPNCKHSTIEEKTECPFGGGCRLIAIEGDLMYYVGRYPSGESDSFSNYTPHIYRYNTVTLQNDLLFSTLSFMQMFEYYQYLDGKIYYVEDELTGDYEFDRWLCAYDVKKGKCERLLKFDAYRILDKTHISASELDYDVGIAPRVVDKDGKAYFYSIHKTIRVWNEELQTYVSTAEQKSDIYIADLKNGGAPRRITEKQVTGGIIGIRKGVLYVTDGANLDYDDGISSIYAYDQETGARVAVAEKVYPGRVCGDILWYRADGNTVVMKNLETSKERRMEIPESKEGRLSDKAGIIDYSDGRLLFKGFEYAGQDEDSNVGAHEWVIFDLVTNQLYPLLYDSPSAWLYKGGGYVEY